MQASEHTPVQASEHTPVQASEQTPVQASEQTRRGRPARKPIRYAVAELQQLLSYLQHNVAKRVSLRDVHKTIEQRRAASGDSRLRAYQWHSFNDRWSDAMYDNYLPSWELLASSHGPLRLAASAS